ncbi:helix-turn-helix domain-containing protein [Bacillus cereus]|uniref:hypothetical protein n=1 Tax=Bacillus cereus TaxID=1396 RepID=UPI003983FFAD
MGCSRFVCNNFLTMWNNTYKETAKGLTYPSCTSIHIETASRCFFTLFQKTEPSSTIQV